MYGHIATLAKAEKEGIEEAGGKVDVFQYVMITASPTSQPLINVSESRRA